MCRQGCEEMPVGVSSCFLCTKGYSVFFHFYEVCEVDGKLCTLSKRVGEAGLHTPRALPSSVQALARGFSAAGGGAGLGYGNCRGWVSLCCSAVLAVAAAVAAWGWAWGWWSLEEGLDFWYRVFCDVAFRG